MPLSSSPFLISLSFRLINAFLSHSFFQPDEYWQSLEPAHLWVFEYGWKTWEWRTRTRGGESYSWENWKEMLKDGGKGGIRSPLSVVPTALVYEILRISGLDDRGDWLILAPRLLQACIAASADVAVRALAEEALGNEYGNAALVVSLTSFFNFFTSTRTLSNSTETALTAWALRHWPWEAYRRRNLVEKDADDENKQNVKETSLGSLPLALTFAALATIIRPSNAIIWLILGARLFLKSPTQQKVSILSTASLISLLAIFFSLVLDTAFYQTPTFTPLRFLSTNVFHSISLFYGQNPWHFYLFQTIPLLLLTQLPFCLDGLRKFYTSSRSDLKNKSAMSELGWTAAGTTLSYSLLSHKEWRFLHPILPILHLFVSLALVTGSRSSVPQTPSHDKRSIPLGPFRRFAAKVRIRSSHLAILLVSLLPALYLSAYHTKGQNDVMIWLRDEMRSQRVGSKRTKDDGSRRIESVGFVMPCHSTPWQSHLHSKELEMSDVSEGNRSGEGGRIWFIGCEPPVLGQPSDSYRDQSDHFYASPSTYLIHRFPSHVDPSFPPSPFPPPDPFALSATIPSILKARQDLEDRKFDRGWSHTWPSHLVVFQNLLDEVCRPQEDCESVGDLLEKKGYRVEREFWNGIGGWHEDERRKGGIVVLRWQGS